MLSDIFLVLGCYGYIVVLILISGNLDSLGLSIWSRRKFLHVMIGNLVLVIPFFNDRLYPFLVAAPFVLITLLVSPVSVLPGLRKRMKNLAGLTEGGHQMGLVMYSISFTILVLFFGSNPSVVAAGVFPMTFGDSFAALVGKRYGGTKYRTWAGKSLEGSLSMFTASALSLLGGLLYFSAFYSINIWAKLIPILVVAFTASVVEALSIGGIDNLTVPLTSALIFYLLVGEL